MLLAIREDPGSLMLNSLIISASSTLKTAIGTGSDRFVFCRCEPPSCDQNSSPLQRIFRTLSFAIIHSPHEYRQHSEKFNLQGCRGVPYRFFRKSLRVSKPWRRTSRDTYLPVRLGLIIN